MHTTYHVVTLRGNMGPYRFRANAEADAIQYRRENPHDEPHVTSLDDVTDMQIDMLGGWCD